MIGLLLPAALAAQAPAAAIASGKVAVVDFQRAITENAEGKKAQEKFVAELNKRQKDFDDKQKSLDGCANKLQTGDKALSDAGEGRFGEAIDQLNTELQRMNDDAQKELGDLQQQLFRPIAEKAQDACSSRTPTENGFAVVFDVSSQASSIIYKTMIADITTEIIRRIDADADKAPAAPAAAAPKPAPAPAKLPAAKGRNVPTKQSKSTWNCELPRSCGFFRIGIHFFWSTVSSRSTRTNGSSRLRMSASTSLFSTATFQALPSCRAF